jgi:hypothetical protein
LLSARASGDIREKNGTGIKKNEIRMKRKKDRENYHI